MFLLRWIEQLLRVHICFPFDRSRLLLRHLGCTERHVFTDTMVPDGQCDDWIHLLFMLERQLLSPSD